MAQHQRPATTAIAHSGAAMLAGAAVLEGDEASAQHVSVQGEHVAGHRSSFLPSSGHTNSRHTHSGAAHSGAAWATVSPQTPDTDWVAETRFGKWFLRTSIWLKYVLTDAVTDLKTLAAPHLPASIDRLMDVGCGQGTAFPLLQRAFAPMHILGVDVDPDMLARAARYSQGSECTVELLRSSVTKLSLPDRCMDVVFCHQLIHHVADQKAALRELHRVLKPGGVLLLSESCEAFISSWPVRWFFRHPSGVQKNAAGYLELLRACGFSFSECDVRAYTPWWSLPDLGLRRRIGRNATPSSATPSSATPSSATELMVVARRA